MRVSLFKVIKKFLARLSFILLKTSSVILIVLISFQIIINNPDFTNSIVQQYLSPQFESETNLAKQEVETATHTVSHNAEQLTLKLKNRTYSEEITVKINNQPKSNFAREVISLELEPGDKVVMDSRGVKEGVWIEILEKPNFIDYKGDFLWLNNQAKEIETIRTTT